MTSSHPTRAPCQWFSRLAAALDRRSAPRLALLFFDAVISRGRRTVTSWIRAAGISDQFRPCYTAVAAAGKRDDRVARGVRARGGPGAVEISGEDLRAALRLGAAEAGIQATADNPHGRAA